MTISHQDNSKYPLSDLQQGMLFHTLSSMRKSTYLVQKVICFSEPVFLEALEKAWNIVIERYAVLRSYFDSDESYYTHQCINDQIKAPISCLDYCPKDYDAKQTAQSLETFLREDAHKGIDLAKPPLMRFTCLLYSQSLAYFIWTYHHALMGGPSTINVLKDVISAYEAFKIGQTPLFEREPGTFYIQELEPIDEDAGRQYWQKLFSRAEANGQAPGNYKKTPLNSLPITTRQSVYHFKLNSTRTDELLNVATRWNLTPSTFIFATWGLLLSRYLNNHTVVFGAVRAYPQSIVQNRAGLFINTLPIIVTTEDQTVASFLREIRQQYKNLAQFVSLPLTKLQRWVSTHPKESLFETFVDFKRYSLNETLKSALGALWVNKYAYQHFDINYTFSLETQEENGCFVFDLNYESNLFSSAMVERYAHHYLQVLSFLLKEEDAPLAALELVKDRELQELYHHSGYNSIVPSTLPTVLDRFDEQTRLNANKIILLDDRTEMTAQTVYDKSMILAKKLRTLDHFDKTKNNEPIVAILLERCVDMVVCILGIWRGGGAFLPIDIADPKSRIESLLHHASVNIILSNTLTLNQYPHIRELQCTLLNIDEIFSALIEEKSLPKVQASQLAYVIYTSGTTGQPKGVMIEHKHLANYVQWFSTSVNLKENDVSILMLPYFFDASYTNLFPALALGNTLYVPSQNTLQDVFSILNSINRSKISYLKMTPSFFRALVRSSFCNPQAFSLSYLRLIILGGEPIDVQDVAQFHHHYPHVAFMNHYGPTETTVGCCATMIDFDAYHDFAAQPVVGQPVTGAFAVVVDSQMRLQPVSVMGELLVGGCGVARGYLADRERTCEKFIQHAAFPGERLYQTGDLACWLENGNLQLGSRKDAQIKIRGHRIEVKEVEQAILDLGIATQVELYKTNTPSGSDRLIAYIEPPESTLLSTKKHKEDRNEFALSSWAQMYDQLYSRERQHELLQFTTGTWLSAYTHEKIPQEQMQEWHQATIERISPHVKGTILEIGCGTGLILFGMQNKFSNYFGVDISSTAIDILRQKIQKFAMNHINVQVACAAAHELDQLEMIRNIRFDTIILNSVVQYFPYLEYLEDVLNWCIDKIADSGVIILGDVRDFRVANAYYDSIFLTNNTNAVQDFEGRRHYQFVRKVQEKELLIDPEYFIRLQTKNKKISTVDILAKQGGMANELNTWRYDVVLKIVSRQQITLQAELGRQYQYQPDIDLETCLDERLNSFYIRKYPNYRLWSSYWTTAYMEGRVEPINSSETTLTLDVFEQLAKQRGYRLKPYLALGFQDAPAYLDLLFVRHDLENKFILLPVQTVEKSSASTKLSTRPMFSYQYQNQDIEKIKASLAKKLPDYMIPKQFIFVPEIPITRNGKIDKKSLLQLSISTSVQTDKSNHVAPRNEIELQLAQIWRDLLSIDSISIYDDFFTLGGDSILSIQFISKCRAHGISIQLIDFIENPNIAGLGSKIESSPAEKTVEIHPQGDVPLTPVQNWFFARNLAHPEYYNQAFFIVINEIIEQPAWEKMFDKLAHHHDSLRLRYKQNDAGVWFQYYDDSPLLFHINNCSNLDEQAFYNEFNRSQKQFNLENGPLLSVAFRGHNGQTQMLIAMHHLIVDGLSWRVLLEDLEICINAYQQNVVVQLGDKTASYQMWSQALSHSVQSTWFTNDYQYWKHLADRCQNKRLPTFSNQSEAAIYQDIVPLFLEFSFEDSRYLTKTLAEEFGLTVHELLFAAYVLSLKEWNNADAFLINLEGHGRETCIEGVDVYRTLGWFTSIYPVLIDLSLFNEEQMDLRAIYQAITLQIRTTPNHGIGFGLLQSLRQGVVPKWVQQISNTKLKFNYLGQFQELSGSGVIHSTKKWGEATTAANNQPDYALFLQAFIKDGQLQCEFRYNSIIFKAQEMQKLTYFYGQQLHSIIKLLKDKIEMNKKKFHTENDQFDLHEF